MVFSPSKSAPSTTAPSRAQLMLTAHNATALQHEQIHVISTVNTTDRMINFLKYYLKEGEQKYKYILKGNDDKGEHECGEGSLRNPKRHLSRKQSHWPLMFGQTTVFGVSWAVLLMKIFKATLFCWAVNTPRDTTQRRTLMKYMRRS